MLDVTCLYTWFLVFVGVFGFGYFEWFVVVRRFWVFAGFWYFWRFIVFCCFLGFRRSLRLFGYLLGFDVAWLLLCFTAYWYLL